MISLYILMMIASPVSAYISNGNIMQPTINLKHISRNSNNHCKRIREDRGMPSTTCIDVLAHGRRTTDSNLRMATNNGQETVSTEGTYSEDLRNSLVWVGSAIAFAGAIASTKGLTSAVEFASGYVLEQSLSIDNLFVFLVLFDYFKVPKGNQEKVLQYGLWGAAVLRAIFIGLGAIVLKEFHQVLLLFAVILLLSSYKILSGSDDDDDEVKNLFAVAIIQPRNNLILYPQHINILTSAW